MNKIILLSDVEQLPDAAFDYAAMLNSQQPIMLAGVFLTTANYMDMLLYYSGGISAPLSYSLNGEKVMIANEAISQFKELCKLKGIEYSVHEKKHFEIRKELQRETRFADLLLFANDAFYETLGSDIFDDYSYDTLHDAECPVLVVPDVFQAPEHIVLGYDGSASSVFAIRRFAYLMPELAKLPTILVYAHPDHEGDFPDRENIEELARRHYPNLTLKKLEMDPAQHFADWLSERKNPILVAGAESRSELSLLFRKSFVSKILKQHKMPVFTAHWK